MEVLFHNQIHQFIFPCGKSRVVTDRSGPLPLSMANPVSCEFVVGRQVSAYQSDVITDVTKTCSKDGNLFGVARTFYNVVILMTASNLTLGSKRDKTFWKLLQLYENCYCLVYFQASGSE